jgi:hypothetical protein
MIAAKVLESSEDSVFV